MCQSDRNKNDTENLINMFDRKFMRSTSTFRDRLKFSRLRQNNYLTCNQLVKNCSSDIVLKNKIIKFLALIIIHYSSYKPLIKLI